MPKFILYFLFMLLILPTTASAKVEVNISNNGEGSKNSVKVNSNTSNNQGSFNSIENHTDIVVESNGERKEYHGSDGNVDIISGDGKSSVHVNTLGATNTPQSSSTSSIKSTTNITVNSNTSNSPSPSSSASANPEASVAGVFKDASQTFEDKKGFWESLKKQIEKFFSFF